MNSPRVSVLMPVRNGERWLREAIQSLLKQTYSDFELLIIDDGSNDNTPTIIADLQRIDLRVHVIRQQQLGLVAALNRGLSTARGSLIARLDADDVALEQRLEKQVSFFDREPNLVLLGTWAEKIDEFGKPTGILRPESDSEKLKTLLLSKNPFVHSSVVFRTSAAKDCGGYRAALQAAEDFDLWLRLAERGDISVIPEALIQYRVHTGSVSTNLAVRQLFSTRLAGRSAMARRSGNADIANQFSEAPDWNDIKKENELFEEACVSRLLQYADRTIEPNISLEEIRSTFRLPLNHAERKIAQMALLNIIRQRHELSHFVRAELLAKLFYLHPARAFALLSELWSESKKSKDK